jgi:hypothetical protein
VARKFELVGLKSLIDVLRTDSSVSLKFTKALDGFANRKGALACFGVYL